MKDSELVDLIRKGASGWTGPTRSASAAKFSHVNGIRRWRSLAIPAAVAAAALLFALSMSGGRLTGLQTILSAVDHQKATPQVESTPSTLTEPTPSPVTEPVAKPNSEPTPKAPGEPTPPPKHEPTPSPEPVHQPTPPEGTPPPPAG